MGEIKRLEKGAQSPENTGQGSTYLIPADDMPKGLRSGDNVKIVLEGSLSIDEQGGVMKLDRIYAEENKRTDPVQDGIESGLNIEMNINQLPTKS